MYCEIVMCTKYCDYRSDCRDHVEVVSIPRLDGEMRIWGGQHEYEERTVKEKPDAR